ncbi:MAG TPA: BlaI/MecI/CopY family transcriptional regulator [Sedimentisphaerales bacterium]|nr:BlaI/MecI/CopY family transcriptional regulator [Sedimentisphaerales bacterium]
MAHKLLDDLGNLQRSVMELVWEMGEATVHQVRDRLDRKSKPAYTTILTAMQKLEKAGWLSHRADGKTYVYLPTRTRQQAGASSVRSFMERMFDGSAVVMFQHLIRDGRLSDAELAELKKMIDNRRKEKKK